MSLTLVLGNKAYSSWSLRGWLALKATGAPFEETVVPLRRPDTKGKILTFSPSGKVPAVRDGQTLVWDTLSIIEYLAERFPQAGLWPADPDTRALARSISAEMHSGFTGLRANMPMDLKQDRRGEPQAPEALEDAARIMAIWRDCRARYGSGGAFLFGGFSAADCMYAPVVTRFETYGVGMDEVSRSYCDAVMAHPFMRDWRAAARAEPWVISDFML